MKITRKFSIFIAVCMLFIIAFYTIQIPIFADTSIEAKKISEESRNYTVRHIRQSLDGTYTDENLAEYETLSGKIGEYTKASANRSYEGFQPLLPRQVEIAADGEITISVYYVRKAYTISFETGDEKQDFNEVFLYGTKQLTPKNPNIPGKIFKYWAYKNADGQLLEWTPTVQSASDLTLYAQYDNPIKSKYIINYWYQNSSDELHYSDSEKTYSLLETETKIQDINTKVKYDTLKHESTYVKYNKNKTESENLGKTVKADGTTVVNVYYDRPVMTITLVYYDLNTGKEDHREDYKGIYGHTTERIVKYDKKYRWTAYKNRTAGVNTDTFSKISDAAMVDDYHIEAHARELASTNKDIKVYSVYHLQNNDGTWTKDMDIRIRPLITDSTSFFYTYQEMPHLYYAYYYWTNSADDFTTDINSLNTQLKPIEAEKIQVYVLKDGKPINDYDGDNVSYLHLYMARKEFPLNFINADNESIKILFGRPLSYAKESFDKPIKPASIPEHYVFDGWYTTADFQDGTKVNLNSTMPSKTKFVYAKWVESNVKVTIKSNGASTNLPDHIKIPIYSSTHRELPTIPSKNGYWFDGWYKDADFTIPFDVNEEVTSDITIYAKWKSTPKANWQVRYIDKNGKILAEADSGMDELHAVLIRFAKNIPEYSVDYLSKNITLTASESTNLLDFIYTYRVKTNWITNDNIKLKNTEYGTLTPEDFYGYKFLTTETDENGDTTHIYIKINDKATGYSVKTGDATNHFLYAGLLVGAIIAIAILHLKYRER